MVLFFYLIQNKSVSPQKQTYGDKSPGTAIIQDIVNRVRKQNRSLNRLWKKPSLQVQILYKQINITIASHREFACSDFGILFHFPC